MVENKFGFLLASKQKKEQRKISFSEISKDTGVSRPVLYRWLYQLVDRYDASVIGAFCKYFNVQPGDLLEYIPLGGRENNDKHL